MFPPPTTMPSWVPSRTVTSFTWFAMIARVSQSIAIGAAPMSASPLIFRRTRRYLSMTGSRLLPELEAGKAANLDVLAGLRDLVRHELLDRHARVLDES